MTPTAAEAAVSRAVVDPGAINSDRGDPANPEAGRIPHQVDGVAAAARRLAADGTITELVRIGCVAAHREVDRATPA
jgi:hypothetical protein